MADPVDGVRIVRVRPEDWPVYREIRLAMLQDSPRAFASIHSETVRLTDANWETFVAQANLWLAYAGDGPDARGLPSQPVGSVGMWADPGLPAGSTYLVGMWVRPAARQRGVGGALIRAVMGAAREAGYRRVVLDVADENDDAAALYRRHGFAPTGVTDSLPWDASITESQMAVDLTDPVVHREAAHPPDRS